MTPVTQTLTACAISGVIVVALWQSRTGDTTIGGFVSFITAMLMLVAPIKQLSDVIRADHARPGRRRARHRPHRRQPARARRHARRGNARAARSSCAT